MKHWLEKRVRGFLPAGLVVTTSSGTGVGDIEGPLEIFFAALIGGVIGFVAGMLIGVLTRVLTMNAVNASHGGMRWAAYGASAGGAVLSVFEMLD